MLRLRAISAFRPRVAHTPSSTTHQTFSALSVATFPLLRSQTLSPITAPCALLTHTRGLRSSAVLRAEEKSDNFCIFEVTPETIKDFVLGNPLPVFLLAYSGTRSPESLKYKAALELAVEETEGAIALGLLDVDEQGQLAGSMNIKTIPVLVIVNQGKVVEDYKGFPTPEKLEAVVQKYVALSPQSEDKRPEVSEGEDDPEAMIQGADMLLQEANPEEASVLLNEVLENDTIKDKYLFARAKLGLALCAAMRADRAKYDTLTKEIATQYPEKVDDPEFASARAAAELWFIVGGIDHDVAEMETQLAKDVAGGDKEAIASTKQRLAALMFHRGHEQVGMDHAFDLVKSRWKNGAGKELLLYMFSLLGDKHELTIKGRRRLANLLF